jgi:hypothetical protein
VTSSAGRWAGVRFPDGRVRFDWVPADQPPAPKGQVGCWHVVTGGPRRPTRWEWHGEPQPAVAAPRSAEAPPVMPRVRPEPTFEVLAERVYRDKRPMGIWFWLGAVVLAAIGGAGAVAMTYEDRAGASLAANSKPVGDDGDVSGAKPTRAGLVTVAEGYLNALLGGDVDDLISYLDPSCHGAHPGFALAARWAEQLSDGATVDVEEVEVRGRRGSVTDFSLDGAFGDAEDAVRRLITNEAADGEQAFPWRFTGGEWYFKGECGSPVVTTDQGDGTSTVPDGGDDDDLEN